MIDLLKLIAERNWFYYLAYGIWLAVSVVDLSYIPIDLFDMGYLNVVAVALLVVHEFYTEDFDRSLLSAVVLITLFEVVTFMFGGVLLDSLILFLFCGRKVDWRVVLRETIAILSALLLLIPALAFSGLITNVVEIRAGTSILRYGMGFMSKTVPSYLVFSICLGTIILRGNGVRCRDLFALLLIDVVIFAMTNTRNGFILTVLLLAAVVFLKIRKNPGKCARFLLKASPYIMICVLMGVFIASALYDSESEVWIKVDEIVSRRLEFSHYLLGEFGLSLFGQRIDWNLIYPCIADCSYIRIALESGLLALALILSPMFLLVYRAREKQDHLMVMLVLIYFIHAAFDPVLSVLYLNPILFISCNQRYWTGD